MQFRHFYRKRSGRRKPEKETGWQQQVSLWTWLFFSIKNSQKVLHAQGFWKAHRYYPADDEICPRSERQVPAVSTASPWNQRNSFWISVSSATEYPSFWQMDSICLFGIPVFGLFEFKISDIWQQLGYRTKLRTTGLMALLLVSLTTTGGSNKTLNNWLNGIASCLVATKYSMIWGSKGSFNNNCVNCSKIEQ